MTQLFRQLPARLDIEFRRGDTLRIPIQLTRNVGSTTAPVYEARDLTGHELFAQVRLTAASTEVVATFTVEPVDLVDGRFLLVLDPEQSANLSKTKEYDVQSTVAGVVRTWIAGQIRPELDVSRIGA